jgi:1,4-dihydroxy-2-naphthoyl-CoA hydrolase
MLFEYSRTIRFADTDAAGVVYFANVLSICHEAYEASLASTGINLKEFFTKPSFALPIVHAEVNFLRAIFCGEQIIIQIFPVQLSENKFEISYKIKPNLEIENLLATAKTLHICIHNSTQTRSPLPPKILQWLNQYQINL